MAGGLISSIGEVTLAVLLLRPLTLTGNSSECSESVMISYKYGIEKERSGLTILLGVF